MLSARSRLRLKGVHPDLVRVIERAAELAETPFEVVEGLRSVERQKALVEAGASTTMNSRHLTGHAVDLAGTVEGKIRWDWPLCRKLSGLIKDCAAELKVPIEWGGDWRNFKDGPHYQLPWKSYPRGK